MSKAREHGYISGVNILCTIGHHNENLSNSLSDKFTRMMDIDGNVCMASLCPNSQKTHQYVREIYAAITEAEPDYIWVDDDVRLYGHMPITCGCFCDTCLQIFEDEYGVIYTRESLEYDLNDTSREEKLEVRKAWMKHNSNTIANLCEVIEKTVHSIKPGLTLGFMTGDRFYEGYDFEGWSKKLAGSSNDPVIWRPGGGAYSGEKPNEILAKAHSIGRQVSVLPHAVTNIQSEIENFPYQCLKKSAHITALEAAAYIAAGCTGAAFNVLTMDSITGDNEALHEYEPIVSKAADMRPFCDLLVSTFGRNMPEGIYTGWNRDIFATNNTNAGNWFEGNISQIADRHAIEALDIGLPAAYSLDRACVSLLAGESVFALSEDEILNILSAGAYIDAKALGHLNQMGYSKLTGFQAAGFINTDGIEQLSDDPLNRRFAGSLRDCRQSFLWWMRTAAVLEANDEPTKCLAKVVDYSGNVTGECCMGTFENSLGGRVCIAGYYPWTFLQSKAKSSQIKSVMRWLSKDDLPAYVSSFHKASIWARNIDGNVAIAIINTSQDTARNLKLAVRTKKDSVIIYDTKCQASHASSTKTDGPYKSFDIPQLDAWDMRLIVTSDQ